MGRETTADLDPDTEEGDDVALRFMGGRVEIKSVTEDYAIIEGYGIIFGGQDLYGDTFTKDTDLKHSHPNPSLFYDHTLRGGIVEEIGVVLKMVPDSVGVWMRSQIDLHKRYAKQVLGLVEEGILGYSTGSIPHLTRREGKVIKSWAIGELSLTPTPAEPRTVGVSRVKHAAEVEPKAETQGDTKGALGVAFTKIEVVTEGNNMGDENPNVSAEVAELESQMAGMSQMLEKLLQHAEDAPAIRNSGYFSQDGGKADKNIKSFGDWLKAVQRNDMTRLETVYGSVKAMSSEDGTDGGFLVPEQYEKRLLEVAGDLALVRPRAMVIPDVQPNGKYPSLDQVTAPTAGVGNTAYAGGVVASWTEESGTISETQPKFKMVEWNLHKLAGYTKVPSELRTDTPFALETLLTRLFGRGVASHEDFSFLRGNGVGQPLGILNSAAAIAISPDNNNVFARADADEMLSRFKSLGGQGLWMMHQSTYPDLTAFEVGTGGAVWLQNIAQRAPGMLGGFPIEYSEHLPQANNSGHVVLADLSAYIIFDSAGMSIAFSEHAFFTTDEVAWRFTKRVDGKPWLSGAIPDASPQGSFTTSPFVYFND